MISLCADGEEVIPTLKLGVPITASSQIVLLQLITHLQSYLHCVGIFRRPGNKNRMDLLIQQVGEAGLTGCLSKVMFTAYDYASVLKQYLAELPEPLLLRRHLEAYLQAAGECTYYTTTNASVSQELLVREVDCWGESTAFSYCTCSIKAI